MTDSILNYSDDDPENAKFGSRRRFMPSFALIGSILTSFAFLLTGSAQVSIMPSIPWYTVRTPFNGRIQRILQMQISFGTCHVRCGSLKFQVLDRSGASALIISQCRYPDILIWSSLQRVLRSTLYWIRALWTGCYYGIMPSLLALTACLFFSCGCPYHRTQVCLCLHALIHTHFLLLWRLIILVRWGWQD